jgi:hypothetical protein
MTVAGYASCGGVGRGGDGALGAAGGLQLLDEVFLNRRFHGKQGPDGHDKMGCPRRDEFAAKTRKVGRVVYFWSTGSVGRVHCHLELNRHMYAIELCRMNTVANILDDIVKLF